MLFALPRVTSPGAGAGRKGKAEPCLSGVCSCPSRVPHSLGPIWEQLQWPKEAQVVGGKVSSVSKKPEEALRSGKGDEGERQGSGMATYPAPPLLAASTHRWWEGARGVPQASCPPPGEGRSSRLG